MTRTLFWLFLALSGLAASPALADEVFLTTGRTMKGEVVSETKAQVVIKTPNGKITLPRHLVKKIVRSEEAPEPEKQGKTASSSGGEVYKGAGVRVTLPKGIRCKATGPEVMKRLSFTQGGTELVSVLSVSRFPWYSKAAMLRAMGVESLRAAPVALGDATLVLDVEGWASRSGEGGRLDLFLLHRTRVLQVAIQTQSAATIQILDALKVTDPGWRKTTERRHRLAAAAGREPAGEALRADVAPTVANAKKAQRLQASLKAGLTAFDQNALDVAETLFLADVLSPPKAKAPTKTPAKAKPPQPTRRTPAEGKAADLRARTHRVDLSGLGTAKVPETWGPLPGGGYGTPDRLGFIEARVQKPVGNLTSEQTLLRWAGSVRSQLKGTKLTKGQHMLDRRDGLRVILTGIDPASKGELTITAIVVTIPGGTAVRVATYANALGADPKLLEKILRSFRWN